MAKQHSNRAKVAIVKVGPFELQGIMTAAGEFFVAASQTAETFQFDKNQASREVKALLGTGFQFDKLATELNPKAVNVIPLDRFANVVAELAFAGNEKAQGIVRAMAALSWEQLFCDAFGRKFDSADRQEFLRVRMSLTEKRRSFTDAVRDWMIAHPEISDNERAFMYSNVTNALYRGVFGLSHAQICKAFQLPSDTNLRDWLPTQGRKNEAFAVQSIEELAARIIDEDKLHPAVAIDMDIDGTRNRGRYPALV